MTLVIPPGFAQAALRFRLSGDPEVMITTCGISVAGNGQAEALALRNAFIASVDNPNFNAGWTFIGTRLLVGQDGGPPTVVESPVNYIGTGPSNGLPNNCSYLVRKQTDRGGRQGRGRMYFPWILGSEGDVDQRGLIAGPLVGGLQAVIDFIFGEVNPFLLHDSTSPGSAVPDAVTAFIVDGQIATQRRRMRS